MYWGHATPSGGPSKFISSSIIGFLQDKSDASDDIEVVGCDGLPINTGEKGGVFREIEKELVDHSSS